MRDEMAGDGPRGKLPRPAGKEVADQIAVGQLRGYLNLCGFIVTIRASSE
ncbi:MAG: hypothetical protein IJS01_03960 [Lentisphaeria bacterium]|nr:hypothetical protein [Lentisphaeria bacterium]